MSVKINSSSSGSGTKAVLTGAQRRWVVRALARWNSPQEVARMVLKEFGVTITRQSVQQYDPTTDSGKGLAPALKKLFFSTREDFVQNIEQLPLSHRAVRLDRLEREYQAAVDAQNPKLVVRILDTAGKEMKPLDYVPDDPDAEDPDADSADEQDD